MKSPGPLTLLSSRRQWLLRSTLGAAGVVLGISSGNLARGQTPKKGRRAQTPPPTRPPLQPADITRLPAGLDRLDLFLLIGQSNMKGRGFMPDQPSRDPRIVMMHLRDDAWYVARHPVHLVGDARTFAGADNAGVGPGLAFAESVVARDAKVRVGLIPCAVGGSPIAQWQRGAKLYDEALRRGRRALAQTGAVNGRIRAALWLQGEADANDQRLPGYEPRLLKLIDDLRVDLGSPELPFIACTIGEMRSEAAGAKQVEMNRLLLSLPTKRAHTACVDARELKTNIGDDVHYDTAAQNEIGRRYAQHYFALARRR